MNILVVGSVALDTIATPDKSVKRALGGSATYFSTAARYFAPVRLVGVVGNDFPEEHVKFLKSRDIDIKGLTTETGPTFHWQGEYGPDFGDARTIDTQLGVFADFHPVIPEQFRDSQFVFLANIDPELQLEVLEQVNDPLVTALDTMNYWITGKPEALKKTLAKVDILLINETEAQMLAGIDNLFQAAQAVMDMGPGTLVIKRGGSGALLFHRPYESGGEPGLFSVPAFLLDKISDPTGAGDTFAGGFVGYLASAGSLNSESVRQAVVAGSVMASFNVQSFSLERLGSISRNDIQKRLDEFAARTSFKPIKIE